MLNESPDALDVVRAADDVGLDDDGSLVDQERDDLPEQQLGGVGLLDQGEERVDVGEHLVAVSTGHRSGPVLVAFGLDGHGLDREAGPAQVLDHRARYANDRGPDRDPTQPRGEGSGGTPGS